MTSAPATCVPVSVAIRLMRAAIASGPAQSIFDENGDEVKKAAGIATKYVNGTPMIILSLVEDGSQTTMCMDSDAIDQFCDTLADAVRWHNAAITPATGSVN